jgi:uncharacterized repeat protein (TIGR01451 family)
MAFVYHGSAAGLVASYAWYVDGDQASAFYGYAVGTAGDVNGDGYADVIVGANSYDNGQTDEGRTFVYYGNGRDGLDLRPQQRRSDDTAPIAFTGWSESRDSFRLSALGRTPFGRNSVKLEWEVKPLGTPFDGTGTGRSATWIDTGTAGAVLNETISGLTSGTSFHWRVRLLYNAATCPFQQASRWFTVPWNGWNETDLSTPMESDLAISQTDTDPVLSIHSIGYSLRVRNYGPDVANGVVVTDNLPTGSAFISATPPQGSCTESGGIVTCSLGTIPADVFLNISVFVNPSTPGVYTNVASVTSHSRDPNMTNNSSSEDTTVLLPKIGGLVWEDRDGDGIQGTTEPRMGGILVELLDDVGTPVNLTLTASDGTYAFSEPAAGVHRVRFDVPTDWVLTTPDQGTDDSLDSDADLFTGETTSIGPGLTVADITRWSAGLRRVGPCLAPDEAIYIYNLRLSTDGNDFAILDFSDTNQAEQVTGYNIYRSSDAGLDPLLWPQVADDVTDAFEGVPDIQWVDTSGDEPPSGVWYYGVAAYNSACDAEGPR